MDGKPHRVAVLGLGITGIGSLKNLLEAGFDAVGFERNNYVGGLWNWTADPRQTSVLKNTMANTTKQKSCYTDFPFPDDVSNYPSNPDYAKYINAYAEKFKLSNHWRLGVEVKRVERENGRWAVRIKERSQHSQESANDEDSKVEYFDKVLVTTGAFHKPYIPSISGNKEWPGRIMHAQEFKSGESFRGKKVVVVGISHTASDILDELLAGGAGKVWVSHRSGARIFKRHAKDGVPLDWQVTRRRVGMGQMMIERYPGLVSKIGSYFADRRVRSENPLMEESWRLLPAAPILNSPATISETIMDHMISGRVEVRPGIKQYLPPGDGPGTASASVGSIEFNDGTILENIDAVICATGYYFDYSILSPSADPTDPEKFPHPEWMASKHVNGLDYPRLYQGILSTTYPDSLAFSGPYRGHNIAAFLNADLIAQAISQIWLGNYSLPNEQEMKVWCDKNYQDNLRLLAKWRVGKVGTGARQLERWLNDAAGNGMNENLGWGLAGWKFWWNQRKLYYTIMDGIDTPFVYRLFDSPRADRGRRSWDGAKEAILKYGPPK